MKHFASTLLAMALCLAAQAQTQTIYRFTPINDIPVTAVKDQAQTGTCWCFATVSFLEAELLRIAPNARISKITHTDNDRYLEHPVTITYTYTIPHFAIVDAGTIVFTPLCARNFFSRAMSHLNFDITPEQRSQPFADACSRLIEVKETITLPDEYKRLHFPFVDGVANPAASFGCQYWMDGNVLTFAESSLLGKRVYNAADWTYFRQVVAKQKLLANTPVILTK